VVNKYNEEGVRWFELKNGKVFGDTGSHRIAFGKWNLLIEGLEPAPSEAVFLSYAT